MGKGKVIILKNTQKFYLTKGYLASETTLPKPSPVWEKVQAPLAFLSHLRERRKKCRGTLMKVTGWGHRRTESLRIIGL